MSKPDTWMPLYVAKYLADTTLLTTEQHGAYLLLLFSGWMHGGSIPDRDDALAAATKMSIAAWRKTRPVLAPMFTIADGVWRQKRQSEELAKAGALYSASVTNGKKGGRPKKPKANPDHNPEANPEANPTHNPEGTRTLTREKDNRQETTDKNLENHGVASQPLSGLAPDDDPENPPINGHKPGSALTHQLTIEARKILAFLNEKAGKQFPPTDSNIGIIVARFREGFKPGQVRQVVAMKVRAWKDDPDMRQFLRPETLFNRTKFSSYVGELVDAPAAPQDAAA